jgi:hypothetical protein
VVGAGRLSGGDKLREGRYLVDAVVCAHGGVGSVAMVVEGTDGRVVRVCDNETVGKLVVVCRMVVSVRRL